MALQDLLGKDTAGIIAGGAEVFLGAKTANGAAGTLFSFGFTLTDTMFNFDFEDFPVFTEQLIGMANSFIVGAKYALELDVAQNNLQAMRVAARLASANLTGAAPGTLLTFNDPSQEFFQAQIVVKGPGPTKIDTYTFWNAQVRTTAGMPFGKKAVQHLKMTMDLFPDTTIVGSPEFVKGLYGKRSVA